MKASSKVVVGFASGVLCTLIFYFAAFHESTSDNKATASEDPLPRMRVARLEQPVSLSPSDLSNLSGLHISSLEQQLKLPSGSVRYATPNRILDDEWLDDTQEVLDTIIAIPIIGSSDHLMVGTLYNHAHAVSIFTPRWHSARE